MPEFYLVQSKKQENKLCQSKYELNEELQKRKNANVMTMTAPMNFYEKYTGKNSDNNKGWKSESARHALARKGIKTGRKR